MSPLPDRFRPATDGATGLFVDTSAWFARYSPRDQYHDDVGEFFGALAGSSVYRPLYVNEYVVDELATGLQSRLGHETAARALRDLTDSESVRVLHVDADLYERARETFLEEAGDAGASFTDVVIYEHATELGVDHVLSYDGDFDSLGLTQLPHCER